MRRLSESPAAVRRPLLGFTAGRENIHVDKNSTGKFVSDRISRCRSFYQKDLLAHFGCVNAIEFSHTGGQWLATGGDDKRVLLWNLQKALRQEANAYTLKAEHLSNIFCLAFDHEDKKIFSGGNDEQVIVHDIQSGEAINVYLHDDAVYGLSVHPHNSNLFASASDDGCVLVWDIREPASTEPFCLASFESAFHAVVHNPVEPRLLATASKKEGVSLWDIRVPKQCLIRYGGSYTSQSAMSVQFNSTGEQLIALRRRLPPVVYDLHCQIASCQFSSPNYFNSCTMKSCCFGGDRDQYILSGSDDFNLYMWKIPDQNSGISWVNEAMLVLKGHRSIVNQVRYNRDTHVIASSGVEKVVKLWSPFHLPGGAGKIDKPSVMGRKMFSHDEYINLVLNSNQGMTHDYSSRDLDEDPRMIAFFDSLIQREHEGWSESDDSMDSCNESISLLLDSDESDIDSSSSNSDLSPPTRPVRWRINAQRRLAQNRQLTEQIDALANLGEIGTLPGSSTSLDGELLTLTHRSHTVSLDTGLSTTESHHLQADSSSDDDNVRSLSSNIRQRNANRSNLKRKARMVLAVDPLSDGSDIDSAPLLLPSTEQQYYPSRPVKSDPPPVTTSSSSTVKKQTHLGKRSRLSSDCPMVSSQTSSQDSGLDNRALSSLSSSSVPNFSLPLSLLASTSSLDFRQQDLSTISGEQNRSSDVPSSSSESSNIDGSLSAPEPGVIESLMEQHTETWREFCRFKRRFAKAWSWNKKRRHQDRGPPDPPAPI